jgi:hypothetical protein
MSTRGPGWMAAGVCGLLCVTLAPGAGWAIESTECATAMTRVQPAPIAVSRDDLAASRLGLFAVPALSGLHIVLVPDAGLAANSAALDAFGRAAAQWEAVISTPVTVTVNAGLEDLGDSRIIGQTLAVTFSGDYDIIRNAIVDVHAEDAPIVTSLPAAAQFMALVPTGFRLTGISATKANLKALGFTDLDTMYGASDATVTFNSRFSFDFDNRDGVTASTVDFETVAAHELGHVLGFHSSVDLIDTTSPHPVRLAPLDLLRFADDPASDPTTPADFTAFTRNLVPGDEAVFDDTAVEYRMSTGKVNGDGRQASHWKDDALTGVLIGAMDPTLRAATVQTVSAADERALELIGWSLVGSVAGPTTTTTVATTSTSPSATAATSSTTSTTLPPCESPRCWLDGALHGASCEGTTIPPSLAHRIERATAVAERAAELSGRKARRTLAHARRLFESARRRARSESTGKRPKLASGCAVAIQDAIDQVVPNLARGAR